MRHGAKVEQKRHGAKRKLCSEEECTNIVVQGGVCIRHGAKVKVKVKRCSSEGCTNQVQRRGVCIKHGAYSNPYDESTVFSLSRRSAHDETTATLPNHLIDASFTNQEQSRDPPSVIVCQVIDYVEV